MVSAGRFGLCLLLGLPLALSAVVGSARATDEPQDEPKAFDCSFTKGNAWSYDGGTFKSETPAPLDFKITDIDLEAQTARLVTGDNTGPLKIVRAINANHFLEVVNEGFLNLTTIYDQDASSGTHPAVHSRHFGLMGAPVFAQYAGTCTPR
jgi:hypothetical protein